MRPLARKALRGTYYSPRSPRTARGSGDLFYPRVPTNMKVILGAYSTPGPHKHKGEGGTGDLFYPESHKHKGGIGDLFYPESHKHKGGTGDLFYPGSHKHKGGTRDLFYPESHKHKGYIRFNNQFGLNGTFNMAVNCYQRMCHFGLS